MAIEVKDIRKSFGAKEVLKGISFVLEQGKVNMIIGASGSGKSVMLKCIVGLMRPDSGGILYEGLDFHTANHKEVRGLRKNMGMLFQYSALFDSMTVEENVGFPLKLFTRDSKREIKKRVEFCLDRVNMSGTNALYPAELSGGMMKRVGIARAIALNPKYLFVDEPNSGLDPLTAAVIDKLIQELTYEFNTCTVVVSHDMNSVVNISDKIMFLFNGQKEWEGDKKDIMHSGNENVDKFVFVSDLIRRDLYDGEGAGEHDYSGK
jgi:phospholipid/cholesterol/gamma-HCH transport system ATP-binding protein